MRWHSALSEQADVDLALAEAAQAIAEQVEPETVDLVILFVTPHFASAYRRIPAIVTSHFPNGLLFGSSAGGVIAEGHEVEQRLGLSLTVASLPEVELCSFHIEGSHLPGPDAPARDWIDLVGVEPERAPRFLLLPDGLTCNVNEVIDGLDLAYPEEAKVGGIASGGMLPGSNALFCADRVERSGVIGLAMVGNLEVDTVVAQGCRPIGEPMLITQCEGATIQELGGSDPVTVLRALYKSLSPRDQQLFQQSLFFGVEMAADKVDYGQGDFLIRNITGVDPNDGSISVAMLPAQWQVAQFHLRDARTAAQELKGGLERYCATDPATPPQGALMFTCLGRGMQHFGRPDHDTDVFQEHFGGVPLGGFFCNGEIGPVGGTTFLHGYTSVFAVFRALAGEEPVAPPVQAAG